MWWHKKKPDIPKELKQHPSFIVHGTVEAILYAIDRNGLEKTLEDMRRHCQYRCTNMDKDNVWQGMLDICLEVEQALAKSRKDTK